MLRIFGSPRRYVQGPGALGELAGLVGAGDGAILIVADAIVLGLLRQALVDALGPHAARATFAEFGGECTAEEITRLADEARRGRASSIVGVGGGKAIDTAKGVAREISAVLVIVPTVASNDSPTSRLAVVYTGEHVLSEVRLMAHNPDAVVVDTSVIVRAPERYFVSGIGDALSKKFEADACFHTGGLNFYKARPPYVALTLANACYAAIREHAEDALAALRRGEPDDAFERTVEATILLSGLAFENGGLSIAHSLTRGLSADPVLARTLHGEQVAWGLLVQLVLEGRDDAMLDDLLGFYRRVGLPRSLRALGYPGDAREVAPAIARITWERAPYVKHLRAPVDVGRIEAAIGVLEARGDT